MSQNLAGKTIGKYELRERLGRGGMAEVYKAYHSSLDRYVALKVLHPFLGEDPEFKERFEREARNVARLKHPGIVQVYDFEHDGSRDLYYMVMEFVDGPTLRQRLIELGYRSESMRLSEAIKVTTDIADALAYAHDRGMVHRDIKPANIMIDSDNRVVLTDFGIARIVSGPNMTASGSMVGTPAYMSPEQGLGQSGDHRSDIYSLGIVLYQMVTGAVPYDADTPVAIVLKHVNDPLPQPSKVAPGIPSNLERIIYQSLAKSPDDRYQTVSEFAYDLRNLNNLPAKMSAASPNPPGMTANPIRAAQHLTARDLPEIEDPASITTQELQIRRRRGGCLASMAAIILAAAAFSAGIYLSYTGLLYEYVPMLVR